MKKRVKVVPMWLLLWDVIIIAIWVFRDNIAQALFKNALNSVISGQQPSDSNLLLKLLSYVPMIAIISIAITIILILANMGRKKQAAYIKEAMGESVVTAQSVPTAVSTPANTTTQVSSNANEGHMNLF